MITHPRRRLAVAFALSCLLAAPAQANPEGAVTVVETLNTSLVDVMKEAVELGYKGRFDKLEAAIGAAYDCDFMAEKVVGRHWKQLSAEQQETWRALFTQLTVANYAGRFKGYTGEHFETVGHQPAAQDTMMVQTKLIVPGDQVIEINYRLRAEGDTWKVIDVYMNGTVSELALRRSDFSSTLKRDGFEKLKESVSEKIASLEAGSEPEGLASAD